MSLTCKRAEKSFRGAGGNVVQTGAAGSSRPGSRGGIELYAEAGTRLRISTLNLSEAFREADGYLALITYAGSKPETDAAL